jgi:hypothetical protein
MQNGSEGTVYKTDKIKLGYLERYDEYFQPIMNEDIKLLELGIFKGESLLLWRDYFKRGTIVGLDLDECAVEDTSGRILTYRGSQTDTALLDRIAQETAPNGFDIIIDDCSHIGEFTRISFWHLFEKHLKPGGIYSIEDWGTGYWDDWPDGKKCVLPKWPSAKYRLIALMVSYFERMAARRVSPQLVSRLNKIAYYKQRLMSHQYGMVGLVKELVDEVGMGDITHPDRKCVKPYRPSRFEKMQITQSQAIIVKSGGTNRNVDI